MRTERVNTQKSTNNLMSSFGLIEKKIWSCLIFIKLCEIYFSVSCWKSNDFSASALETPSKKTTDYSHLNLKIQMRKTLSAGNIKKIPPFVGFAS